MSAAAYRPPGFAAPLHAKSPRQRNHSPQWICISRCSPRRTPALIHRGFQVFRAHTLAIRPLHLSNHQMLGAHELSIPRVADPVDRNYGRTANLLYAL